MNEVVNKFLLVGNKFMPEMHLKQPRFTYSACGPFTQTKKRIEKFMLTGDTNFIYKNELDKACFQHDMAYGKTKDLVKITQSDKALKDKLFKIASDPKYDDYQRELTSMVYKFLAKKSSGNGMVNKQFINWQMNFMNQLSENLRKEKFIHVLETIFGALI